MPNPQIPALALTIDSGLLALIVILGFIAFVTWLLARADW